MKKIIFTAMVFLAMLYCKGQQKLSYSYDTAGNRTSRTVVAAARNASDDVKTEVVRIYADSLAGESLVIYPNNKSHILHITVDRFDPHKEGLYTLLDGQNSLFCREKLKGETTFVKLDTLPAGSYTRHILIDRHSSVWNMVKL